MRRRATPVPMPGSALLKTMGQREIRDNMRTHVSLYIEKRVSNGLDSRSTLQQLSFRHEKKRVPVKR